MFALTFIIQKALNKPMKNLLKKPKKSPELQAETGNKKINYFL